jgi:Tol biopolymer transport system component
MLYGILGAQPRQQQQIDLQAAIRKETIDGDLNGAIKQYAAIVSRYGKIDRVTAATALVHMAECHQKLGDAEARKIYEQIVRDYADQKDAVAMARANLGFATPQPTTRTVWTGTGIQSFGLPITLEGNVSLDGRYMTYRDGTDVVVRELSSGVEQRIPNKPERPGGHLDRSAISVDDKQVVFAWHAADGHSELRIANLNGDSASRRLYASAADTVIDPHEWSPDSRQIVVEVLPPGTAAPQIALISVPEGSLRILKTSAGPEQRGGDPTNLGKICFSPDGKYLAYDQAANESGERRDVYAMRVDNGAETPAPVHRGRDIVMGWSPDGSRLLMASDRSGSVDLWSVPFAQGEFQGQAELLQKGIGEVLPLGVTRSGALYYSPTLSAPISRMLEGVNVQVASIDFATGKLLTTPRDLAPETVEPTMAPTWSPDGKYLASTAWRGGSGVLVIRSAETLQTVRELQVNVKGFVNYGVWSPDGKFFVSPERDSQDHNVIYRIDAKTGKESVLVPETNGEGMWYTGISPDGNTLYFCRTPGGKGGVYVARDIASGNEKELIRSTAPGRALTSPDGRYLAIAGVDPTSNSRTVLLVPTSGGEPREVLRVPSEAGPADLGAIWTGTNVKGQVVWPAAWMPDSRSLIVRKRLSDEKRPDELWLLPIDGGAARKLELHLDRNPFLGMNPLSVHPDGKHVAYMLGGARQLASQQSVRVLENFLPKSTSK